MPARLVDCSSVVRMSDVVEQLSAFSSSVMSASVGVGWLRGSSIRLCCGRLELLRARGPYFRCRELIMPVDEAFCCLFDLAQEVGERPVRGDGGDDAEMSVAL